jgi:hypothetical protein
MPIEKLTGKGDFGWIRLLNCCLATPSRAVSARNSGAARPGSDLEAGFAYNTGGRASSFGMFNYRGK